MWAVHRLGISILACCGLAPALAQDAPLVLPSGVEAQLHETIWDEGFAAIRLRYVVPQLSEPGSLYYADSVRVFDDMQWLCETQLPTLFTQPSSAQDQGWNMVVISLMNTPIEFGARDTDILQLFEWFSLTMDGCEAELDEYHD
jgi:hypothetical protein